MIATNIAETSITIDGIYYVVDPGFVKQNAYDPRLGMDSLVVTPISQAQARQRSGRAGQNRPREVLPTVHRGGVSQCRCFRAASPRFNGPTWPTPSSPSKPWASMTCSTLISWIRLRCKKTLITALEQLYALGALDEEGLLTRLGRRMAEFPMEPQLSKMLILSVDMGCSEEVLTHCRNAERGADCVLHVQRTSKRWPIRRRPSSTQPEGDHLTLLTVYNAWKKE